MEIDARILQYAWKCQNRGIHEETVKKRKEHLSSLVKLGVDLDNPKSVETVLALQSFPTPTKWLIVTTYNSYCKQFKIQWDPIKVRYEPKIPYIPTEEECKIFIAGLGKICSIFCRVLYETGARCGEACKIEWTDIDEERCTITINHPLKGSRARVNKVSRECIVLLNRLPRKYGNHVFNPNPRALHGSFQRQRAKLADKLGKPQLLKVHFHTFRHVRGTMDIHNHILMEEVQDNLGHKYMTNTQKYIHFNKQLFHEKDDRFQSTSAATDDDAGKLIETGWTFVCVNPNTNRLLFRKPK
jgi:integrase